MKLIITSRDSIQTARKRCIRKFLHYFKKGFEDEKYIAWERQYKLDAHLQFQQKLNRKSFKALLTARQFEEISRTAIQAESKTNLLFSFEKMAIRDAVKSKEGAEQFASGLFNYLYSGDHLQQRFENFVQVISHLPRKQRLHETLQRNIGLILIIYHPPIGKLMKAYWHLPDKSGAIRKTCIPGTISTSNLLYG